MSKKFQNEIKRCYVYFVLLFEFLGLEIKEYSILHRRKEVGYKIM